MLKKNKTTTEEQRKLWKPILWQVWGYIASDAEEGLPQKPGKYRAECIIELVVDASRPVTFGKMSAEDYAILGPAAFHDKDTRRWLLSIFKDA